MIEQSLRLQQGVVFVLAVKFLITTCSGPSGVNCKWKLLPEHELVADGSQTKGVKLAENTMSKSYVKCLYFDTRWLLN